jgi:hypothetical protein
MRNQLLPVVRDLSPAKGVNMRKATDLQELLTKMTAMELQLETVSREAHESALEKRALTTELVAIEQVLVNLYNAVSAQYGATPPIVLCSCQKGGLDS